MIKTTHTPYPQRVRNTLRFRTLQVLHVETLARNFIRVVLGGPELADFSSTGFDDHVKVFFPAPGVAFVPPQVTEEGIVWADDVRPAARDYTPLFDAERGKLSLDFFLHEAGLASDWARQAKVGDSLTIGGPRGSLEVPIDYGWQLYVCDETGLPALRRRLETLRAAGHQGQIQALVTVADPASRAYLDGLLDQVAIQWLSPGDEEGAIRALSGIAIPAEHYFIWITGEGKRVKALSQIVEDKADPELLRAVAYWHNKA